MSHENLMSDNIKLVADMFDCYLTAQSKVQISYCKKTCLTTWLCALSSLSALLFLPYEKWAERLSRKKQFDNKWLMRHFGVYKYHWEFLLIVCILTGLTGSSNKAQLTKILSDSTCQND